MSIGDENRSTPGQLGVDPADGIDIMRYRDRPSQEDILNEAERMAKGILILSRIVKEKFNANTHIQLKGENGISVIVNSAILSELLLFLFDTIIKESNDKLVDVIVLLLLLLLCCSL